MVIDTSAFVAILLGEAEAAAFDRKATTVFPRLVSAATLVETYVVMIRRSGAAGRDALRDYVEASSIHIVALTPQHVELAAEAFQTFGKGRHPAALNFGDCFSYALAKATGEPLLFKGHDFAATDIRAAA